MKYLVQYRLFESISSESLRNSSLESINRIKTKVLELCLSNTQQEYKGIVKIAYNRIVNKLFPLLKEYLIPTIKVNGKVMQSEKNSTPEQFFTNIWPKFWDSFTSIERGLIKKFTTLSKETTYKEIIEGAQSAMSDFGFSGMDKKILEMIYKEFYNELSNQQQGVKIEISSNLLNSIAKDLETPEWDPNFISELSNKAQEQEDSESETNTENNNYEQEDTRIDKKETKKEKREDRREEKDHERGEKLKDGIKKVGDKIGQGLKKAGNFIEDRREEKDQERGEKLKDGIKKVGEKIGQGLKKAGNFLKTKFDDFKDRKR